MAGKSFGMSFDKQMITAKLEKLSKDMQEQVLRPAMYEVCTVLYNEIKLTTPVDQGTLQNAVYRFRNADISKDLLEFWTVGINHKKAPHFHFVEDGYWQIYKVVKTDSGQFFTTSQLLPSPKWIPPTGYFRAANDSAMPRALQAGLKVLETKLEKLV